MTEYHPREYEVVIDRYQMIRNKLAEFSQFDTESAKLIFKFLENGIPFKIPYTRLVLYVKKPDQKEVYQDIDSFSGNTAEIVLNNQALTAAGILRCQIRMYEQSKLESTWTFEVKVNQTIGNDDAIKSDNKYQVLQQLFIDVDGKVKEMDQTITENIYKNNEAVNKNIDAMKSATDEAIKSIDNSSLGQLNQQVLEPKYQTFTASGPMSHVGENKISTQINIADHLDLDDEDYEQLEQLGTPSTLDEPMVDEDVPATLEEPMDEINPDDGIATIPEAYPISNEVVPIESGFAKSAILKGNTLVNCITRYRSKGTTFTTENGSTRTVTIADSRDIILKPNTKYMISANISNLNLDGVSSIVLMHQENSEVIFTGSTSAFISQNGMYKVIVTTAPTLPIITDSNWRQHAFVIKGYNSDWELSSSTTRTLTISDPMIIEYIDGMENWDIQPFEGMCSVKMPVLKMTGKNFCGKMESGSFSQGGGAVDSPSRIRSTDFISIDTSPYYVSTETSTVIGLRYYDGNKNCIGYPTVNTSPYPVRVTNIPPGTKYMKFTVVDITDVNYKVYMTKEAHQEGEYEPYKSNILSVPVENHKGFGDVHDTVDLTKSVDNHIERIGEVVLNGEQSLTAWNGTESQTNTLTYNIVIDGIKPTSIIKSGSLKYFSSPGALNLVDEEGVATATNNRLYLRLNKSRGTTPEEVMSSLRLTPIAIQYELATPLIKTVDLNGKPFFFKDGHIMMSSASEEQSLLPTLEYTVPTNLRGQAENNAEQTLYLEDKMNYLDELKLGVNDKAYDSTMLDGSHANINAAANTIVKRNSNGDIATGSKLNMKLGTSVIPVEVIADKHLKVDTRNVWDDGNLPIEKGTFTPFGYGGDNSVQFTHTLQQGTYYRVGKMVTVNGRINASSLNSAAGHFRIGGLPFRIREQYAPCVLGFVSGIKLGSTDIQVNSFGELAYQFIQFTFNNINTGAGWSNVGVNKLIAPLDISFSMTYLTD